MRYIIETKDEQGIIGIQINKWLEEQKIDLIEKGEPVIELQNHLERVARALELLKKSGYNQKVMKVWIKQQTKLSWQIINSVLEGQESFFEQIGVLK